MPEAGLKMMQRHEKRNATAGILRCQSLPERTNVNAHAN
jgi:hypothetical protein